MSSKTSPIPPISKPIRTVLGENKCSLIAEYNKKPLSSAGAMAVKIKPIRRLIQLVGFKKKAK